MSTNTPDLKAQIKSVNVIYYSFLAGLLFVGVSSALTDESSKLGHDETLNMIFFNYVGIGYGYNYISWHFLI